MAHLERPARPESLLASLDALGERIRAEAPRIDRERHVPDDLVEQMRGTGLFRMVVPKRWGGWELPAPTVVQVGACLARYDASTAWVGMIGSTTHVLAAYLPEEGAAEIYADGPDFLMGGLVPPPTGEARAVDGGYRVSGRFPFGSASRHCGWFVARCRLPTEDETPPSPREDPNVLLVFVRAEDVTVHDTWQVVGLRGSGSHDFEIRDVFVPERRAFRVNVAEPVEPGPLYRVSRIGLLPAYLGGICVGIGRGAIDAFTAYASAKMVAGRPLTELPQTRARLAEAEAVVEGARAYLLDVARTTWAKLEAGEDLDVGDRAAQLLSATHAAQTSARAVELMYTSAGSAALSLEGPLQRLLRDVHAAKQHALVGFGMYETAGGMLFAAGA